MGRFTGILGLLVMVGLAYAFSTNRKAIRVKTVAWGLSLQIVFAFFVLRSEMGRYIFKQAGAAVNQLLSYSVAGSEFVFGQLGGNNSSIGLVFAFRVLPTIIFIAAFFALLYHFGIMQFVIRMMARFMTWVMGVSGAESLNVAASIFMGQTEAPLTIRPYLAKVTRSELMTIMTSGMAHVSGGIMAAYITVLAGNDVALQQTVAQNILTAVIMTAPGTILVSKMLVPETEQPLTAGKVELHRSEEEKKDNFLGAIARGTSDGLHLAINVAAMLIAFLALIALTNGILGGISGWLSGHGITWFPTSLQMIFGWILAPVAWLIGIPWQHATSVGNLLGTRMVINELVAFTDLGTLKATLDPRSVTIATFAICGFANFSSIGIQIGGIGALVPERRGDLASLGIRAMLAGTMANLMSASIVSMLI